MPRTNSTPSHSHDSFESLCHYTGQVSRHFNMRLSSAGGTLCGTRFSHYHCHFQLDKNLLKEIKLEDISHLSAAMAVDLNKIMASEDIPLEFKAENTMDEGAKKLFLADPNLHDSYRHLSQTDTLTARFASEDRDIIVRKLRNKTIDATAIARAIVPTLKR